MSTIHQMKITIQKLLKIYFPKVTGSLLIKCNSPFWIVLSRIGWCSSEMNILVLGRCLPNGRNSFGMFEFDQALALAEAGHNVVYGYSDNRSIKVNRTIAFKEEVVDGLQTCGEIIPVGGLPFKIVSWFKTRGLKKVLTRLSEEDFVPDVVYAHFPLLTLTSDILISFREMDLPLVCMEHWSRVENKSLPTARVNLLNEVVAAASCFCSVSKDLQDSVEWYCQDVGEKSLRVIPDMVNEKIFYPKLNQKAQNDHVTFVAAGRLVAGKRFDFLLEAFAKADLPTARLLIAGAGDQKGSLTRLATKLGIEKSVVFLGWLSSEDLAEVMRNATCFVAASDLETFCLPIAEAWMCGLPCIAPDVSALRDYFEPWNGSSFDSTSKESLAYAMKEIASSDDQFVKNTIASWSAELFSRRAVVSQLEDAFTSAII